jgi:MFS family permease
VLFFDGLDVSMVGVALPSIRADLGLSTSQLQWIVSGYTQRSAIRQDRASRGS